MKMQIPMALRALKLYILFLFFLNAIINASGNRQLLPPEIHDCENGSIVHIRAVGANDTLHRLFSSNGSFVVLTAITSKKAQLTVNCSSEAGSAYFNEMPKYSYALMFTKMFSFNDADDEAKLPDVNFTTIPFYQMKWYPADISQSSNNKSISVEYRLLESKNFTNNTLKIKLSAYDYEEREKVLPHLVHTINSTQIEVILDDAPVSVKNPRFAIQMFLLVKKNDSKFNFEESRSLDDEFTPGVFKFVQINSGYARDKKLGAFAQWKPIVYTYAPSDRSNTTITDEGSLKDYNITSPDDYFLKSLTNAFYGSELESTYTQIINITFGAAGDGFYNKTSYSSWTLSTGYGIPPQDEISTTIIIILVCGLGIPLILLIAGIIFVFVKRSRQKDDLLLSD